MPHIGQYGSRLRHGLLWRVRWDMNTRLMVKQRHKSALSVSDVPQRGFASLHSPVEDTPGRIRVYARRSSLLLSIFHAKQTHPSAHFRDFSQILQY